MKKKLALFCLFGFFTFPLCSESKLQIRLHPDDSKIIPSSDVFYSRVLPGLKGKKTLLVTNPSGIGINPNRIKSEFSKQGVILSQLIGLEHGFFGLEEEFNKSPVTLDSTFDLPIYHIYKLSTSDLLKVVQESEAIVFDVQGMGMRCYTYLTVLKRLMDASAGRKIRFVVLDHISPSMHLGGQGDFVEKAYQNFAGEFPSPLFTGLTLGEAALFYNAEYLKKKVDLEVVPVGEYKRGTLMENAGIPWNTPSPNLPNLDSARNYFSLVFLEGVNVSVGRGTQAPFVYFGAPWMEQPEKFAEELNKSSNKEYYFTPVYFKPTFGPHTGKICKGLRMNLVNPNYDPLKLTYNLIATMKRIYSKDFAWTKWSKIYSIDYLWGNPKLRVAIDDAESFENFAKTFKEKEAKYNSRAELYWLY
jgi:uncharacterized protein YbbC (DUF1343 family)